MVLLSMAYEEIVCDACLSEALIALFLLAGAIALALHFMYVFLIQVFITCGRTIFLSSFILPPFMLGLF